MAQEIDPRHLVIIELHGCVTLGKRNVARPSLRGGGQLGLGVFFVKTLGRQAKEIWTDCWNTFGCRCCLVSSKRDAGRGTQSLCLRRSTRTNGFASGVGSACVGQLNRSRKSRKN